MAAHNAAGSPATRLVWLKSTDLRMHDNPVLTGAHAHKPGCQHGKAKGGNQLQAYEHLRTFLSTKQGGKQGGNAGRDCNCAQTKVLHVFVFDPVFIGGELQHTGVPKMNVLRVQFLLHTLVDLQQSLRKLGGELHLAYGNTAHVLERLCKIHQVSTVYTSAVHTTDELKIQQDVSTQVKAACGATVKEYWMNSMVDMGDCPFKYGDGPDIFTSFRKQIEKELIVHDWSKFTPALDHTALLSKVDVSADDSILSTSMPEITKFGFTQDVVDQELKQHDARTDLTRPVGGETAAVAHMHQYFFEHKELAQAYKETRNGMLTTTQFSTKFSPALAHGALSPRLVYWAIKHYEQTVTANTSTYWIIFEMLWRDYWRLVIAPKYKHNLFTKHGIQTVLQVNQTSDYIEPGWSQDSALFRAWQDGRTGYSIVDAAMRELRTVGWMSNRSRQIVASFLTKDMGLDWRLGAEWFESQLIDYDCASNWGNWQYAAGVGTDPRAGRYFSLAKQAKQYDADHAYQRYWLRDDYVHGQYQVEKVCALRFDGQHNSSGGHGHGHGKQRDDKKHYRKHAKQQRAARNIGDA